MLGSVRWTRGTLAECGRVWQSVAKVWPKAVCHHGGSFGLVFPLQSHMSYIEGPYLVEEIITYMSALGCVQIGVVPVEISALQSSRFDQNCGNGLYSELHNSTEIARMATGPTED